MRRGIALFASALGFSLACGSFREGADDANGDAGGGVDGSVDAAAAVDAQPVVDAAPTDGNPCSSRAAKFGDADFFDRGPVSGFDPAQMTVEAWIYVPKAAANRDVHLVSHVGAGKLAGWALGLTPGPNLVFYSYTNGGANTLGGNAPASSVATNRWVHVAVTRDGTIVQLIIDGNKSAPLSNTFKFGIEAVDRLTVGANSLDEANGFQGLMEEVRISNVVREISIARKTVDVDANTLALWRFDEKDGDALDSSAAKGDMSEEGTVPRVCMPRFADDDVTP